MTYPEIVSLVSRGEPLPPFQSLPDRLCYGCLATLKTEYEQHGLDEKRVKAGKRDIRRAHEEASEAFRQYMAVYKEYNDNRIRACGIIRNILAGVTTGNPDYKALFLMAVDCIGLINDDDITVKLIRDAVNFD